MIIVKSRYMCVAGSVGGVGEICYDFSSIHENSLSIRSILQTLCVLSCLYVQTWCPEFLFADIICPQFKFVGIMCPQLSVCRLDVSSVSIFKCHVSSNVYF